MAAVHYFQENSWGFSLPRDVERVAGTETAPRSPPPPTRSSECAAPMLLGKQKSQASGPSTIMKSSSLREQRTGQPDLGHRKASRGAPTPSPPLGTLTGKAEVQETRLVMSMLDTSTFSSARIFLEGTHACTLPSPDRSNI